MTAIAETTDLTAAERDLLETCEATISRGLETFREVGDALMSVRDNRLYRTEFGTFDEYAATRWQLSERRLNQLISAAAVAKVISGTTVPEIKNEAQARELAPLLEDPDEMQAAFTEAVERSNGKPTAAVIRDVVRERMDPESHLAKVAERELDKAEDRQRLVNEHNAHVAEVRKGLTPERIAEIRESIKPAVEFAQLADACRQFLELLSTVDFEAAVRGYSPEKASPIREAVDRLPLLRRALEAQA